MTKTTEPPTPGFGNPVGRAEPGLHSQGHSGCQVTLIRSDGHVFVEKSSRDPRYNARLAKQFDKQKATSDSNRLPFLRIPRIVERGERDGLAMARMEYVYFLDSIDYFASASIVGIDQVASKILAFIDAEVAESPLVRLPAEVFGAKIGEIERTLRSGDRFDDYAGPIRALQSVVRDAGSFELPVGRCHGDLTFSNIMIASDSTSIALIDFLDSFVESPIIDIAKVRQDSRFCWSLLMASRQVDPVRFRLVMRYIDATLTEHYRAFDWYARNIDLLLALNLLRIAPYAKRQDVHEFLLDAIRRLELRR